jgi:hypothetical protein
MLWKLLVVTCALWIFTVGCALAQECNAPNKEVNLDLYSSRLLKSPNEHWEFTSIGPHFANRRAILYLRNNRNSRSWRVGSIERNGTAFWSEDSKRLFLRDEYAADDTRIRVFDATGPIPKEINGLNHRIQRAISAHIPPNKTTQWLYFPVVCFAPNDSSTIILTADAPLDPKRGDGSGTPFRLRLTVNLMTLQVGD